MGPSGADFSEFLLHRRRAWGHMGREILGLGRGAGDAHHSGKRGWVNAPKKALAAICGPPSGIGFCSATLIC